MRVFAAEKYVKLVITKEDGNNDSRMTVGRFRRRIMIDFRIDTFLTACRYMNFTRAAEELNITQPAVTQHIHYLEQLYKVKLFTYQGKRMLLTDSGKLLLNAATTMKHDEIYLKEKLKEIQKKQKKLFLGATRTAGEFILPKRIAAYLRKDPDAIVKMTVANTEELLKKMDAGEIDCALVEGFFDKGIYDSLTYSRERFVAVCSADYEFAGPVKTVEDLFSERLIIRESGSGSREIMERYLESRNLSVKEFEKIIEISNIHAIKSLAEEGAGITFLYEAAVKEELERGTLREVQLEEFEQSHDMTFIWRRNSIFDEYYHDLFESLKE